MRTLRERLAKDDGFTLIELMVVVLIIAVLVAIAIPSFLGFRARAQDRAAQSDIRNVLLSEKAYWTDNGEFTETEADLKGYEPSIVISTDPAAGVTADESVSGNTNVVCLTRESASGDVFAIFEDESANGGTYYGAGASITCPTTAASGGPTSSASTNWSTAGFPSAP
jgi:type IV pilus assembly protein PilA